MGALKNKMKAFANKIEGVSIVDNMANPASAASRIKRSLASGTVVNKPLAPAARPGQTYGVGVK